jgi:hypothetical protein
MSVFDRKREFWETQSLMPLDFYPFGHGFLDELFSQNMISGNCILTEPP